MGVASEETVGSDSLIGYSLWGHKELDRTERLHFNYFADKSPSSQSYVFSSSHLWMWKLDQKESWALKNWCFWTVVLEKTLESPLDCRESKPVNPKWNEPWILTGKADTEAEAPILWPLDGKVPNAGKDWGQEERMRWLVAITDSMNKSLSKLRDSEGWGSLMCSEVVSKQLDTA